MMDVSLLTSNATQLRSVLSNPHHDFHTLLLVLISLSIIFQVTSGVLMIVSDFYKTQVKVTDQQNQRKRKVLNFISLALVMIVTALNIMISAFYSTTTPGQPVGGPHIQDRSRPSPHSLTITHTVNMQSCSLIALLIIYVIDVSGDVITKNSAFTKI